MKQKYVKAKEILQKMARWNGRSLPEDVDVTELVVVDDKVMVIQPFISLQYFILGNKFFW